MNPFRFNLGAKIKITCSGEEGEVIARAQYLHSEDSYLIRYRGADGGAVESWWSDSALS